jgi:hypothetical protein
MASPEEAPLSASAYPAEVRIVETLVPDEVVASSVPVNVTVDPLVTVGASLTSLTAILAVAEPLENAEVPPEVEVSAVFITEFVEAVPLVASHALNDNVAVSPLSPSGT